jgi:hypothetical protein
MHVVDVAYRLRVLYLYCFNNVKRTSPRNMTTAYHRNNYVHCLAFTACAQMCMYPGHTTCMLFCLIMSTHGVTLLLRQGMMCVYIRSAIICTLRVNNPNMATSPLIDAYTHIDH